MELEGLFSEYHDRLEDFWGRRQNKPRFVHEFCVFDRRIRLSSNHEKVQDAAHYCQPLYSAAPPTDDPPLSIQIVVPTTPTILEGPPDNLFNYVEYTGAADWLMIQLDAWGNCYVDLSAGRAVAVLSAELAQRPERVSQCLLNTVITNFFIAAGYGMLHASCLLREGRALLLMAPHNSGKSTTALRLVLAGYQLLSDSMIFLPPGTDSSQLLGFPVGKVKLRRDVLPEFPQLRPLLTPEPVRDEVKYSLDLRAYDPSVVCEERVQPTAVDLCLLERSGEKETRLTPATETAVVHAVMRNSLFYDNESVWERGLAAIKPLIQRARWHYLAIGWEAEGILRAVDRLWNGV